MADRRVVMLAYWYPPCSAYPTAAARVAGFARHLPEHGWLPTIVVPRLDAVTCGCAACAGPGAAVPDEPVGVEVVRVPVGPSAPFRVWSRVRPPSDRWSPTGSTGESARRADRGADGSPVESGRGVRQLVATMAGPARALVELRTAWPGAATAELDRRLPAADALWTTSWPFVHTRIGMAASRRHGLPWIADLRDPVARAGGEVGISARALLLQRRLRARELRRADRVVEVTEPLADVDEPWLGRRPDVVRSGYDGAAWAGVRGLRDPQAFTLVLTGTFYRGLRGPSSLLAVLASFLEGLDPRERARVRLVYHGRQGGLVRDEAARAGVEDVVEDRGWLEVDQLRPRLRGADVLVLQGNSLGWDGVPGGKFYEYLAAGPYVLAHPGGDRFVRDLLAETGAGSSPTDAEQAVATLRALYERWRSGRPLVQHRDERAVAGHDQRVGAASLAAILDEVASASAG